eukprot:gnl/MRDRNA2_/MRDRNA2_81702_c0_seq2.p1 gnl/MRDRNA2_/MRDRNA2_81702_c0~~gnl/MRDRNA2_/MRDRNA2_81702_c0_seq2.p1  ORF type:complete len:310 (-),score=22.00 gnl/MRDRNA2_/MRDRNA2_81702_c0_seq2:27-869(-)
MQAVRSQANAAVLTDGLQASTSSQETQTETAWLFCRRCNRPPTLPSHSQGHGIHFPSPVAPSEPRSVSRHKRRSRSGSSESQHAHLSRSSSSESLHSTRSIVDTGQSSAENKSSSPRASSAHVHGVADLGRSHTTNLGFDGHWVLAACGDNVALQHAKRWLRSLSISGDTVTLGDGSIATLDIEGGQVYLQGGLLTMEGGTLHRDGKSGFRFTFQQQGNFTDEPRLIKIFQFWRMARTSTKPFGRRHENQPYLEDRCAGNGVTKCLSFLHSISALSGGWV